MEEGPTVPTQQRAWVNTKRGSPAEAIVLTNDWPVQKDLAPGEVLVSVSAAALNPVGYKFFRVLPNFLAGRPRVAEYDLSGIIVDSNGTNFKNGDNVFGWVPSYLLKKTNRGALCEYSKLSSEWLVKRPPNISPIEAAGVALVGLTAYSAIVHYLDLQAGQRIFINGGSTSVGTYAIQLAKIKGAHVTASASAKNEQFVRGLGADDFVDYTSVNLPVYLEQLVLQNGRKFDHILEAVGLSDPSLYTGSGAYLSPMGDYLTVGPWPNSMSELGNIFKTVVFMLLPRFLGGVRAPYRIIGKSRPQNKDLEQLQEYLTAGSLKPAVDSVFDFENALKAYERLMTKRVTGKVVVKVDPSLEWNQPS
jgi:NADPH:quinone reductase-like Zn-dependent oxidoreductase